MPESGSCPVMIASANRLTRPARSTRRWPTRYSAA
jgi:hypothetical protein